jgi:O-antigen biosynthesis protein
MQKANKDLRESGKSWGDYVNDHARSICSGDGIIVSTEHLRDVYWKQLGDLFGKKNLPEIFVCRNLVDERFVPTDLVPPREDGKLRVGYMGSDSHLWDVDLIYEACVEAFVNGHEIVFIGIDPANINPIYRRSKKDWSRIDYTHIPWTNTFRGTALPLDIGFCPLVVDEHTLCKSDIKWLEYALSGAATIAQNCLVYNRTAKHNETALLASGPAEYVHQMRRLIQDAELRKSLVDATREYIREERMLLDHADEWKQAVYG